MSDQAQTSLPQRNGEQARLRLAVGRAREECDTGGRRLRTAIIWLLLIAVLAVVLLLAVPGLHGVGRALRHMDADAFAGAVGLELVSGVGFVLALMLVFPELPRRFAWRLGWAEQAFGAALPFGGGGAIAVGAWVLGARGWPAGRIAERSAVLFLVTSAINVIVLVISGLGLFIGLPGPSDPLLSILPAAIGVATFLFFLSIPSWAPRVAHTRFGDSRVGVIICGLVETIRDVRRLLVTPDLRLLGAYAYLLADIAVLYVCLTALGVHLSAASVVLAYQMGYMSNLVPIPGAIGVLDSSLIGLLVVYGAHATRATAAVLVYHAIALWVPTLLGGFTFLALRRTLDEPLPLRPPDLAVEQAAAT